MRAVGADVRRMRPMAREYDFYLGIDIGKSFHHAVGYKAGDTEKAIDRRVEQSEEAIVELIEEANAYGRVCFAVDQASDVGGLLVAACLRRGEDVSYLPTYTMRQAARLYPGYAKTDAIDAAVIADVAMRMPDLLIPLSERDALAEELAILSSQHAFLSKESVSVQLRMRGMIARMCPALERALPREKMFGKLALQIFARYGGPAGLREAGYEKVLAWAEKKPRQCTRAPRLVGEMFDAMSSQTIEVAGASAMERCVSADASMIQDLFSEMDRLDARMVALLDGSSEAAILRSMPGIGDVWCAVILGAIGSIDRFPSAGHLASYAGLAPGRWESGTSIRGSVRPRGNGQLKNALRQAAQSAARYDERSKAYYEKKRSEGRSHGQAISALARRRVDVMYAMLKNGEMYSS